MTVIVLNCFTLALYDPRDPECEKVKCKVLAVMDLSFTLFFFCEMVIKMLAMGVSLPHATLRRHLLLTDCTSLTR